MPPLATPWHAARLRQRMPLCSQVRTELLLVGVRAASGVVTERYVSIDNALSWWSLESCSQRLMEMSRRVFLLGILILVERGSVTQIALGTVFCATYLLLVMQAGPYVEMRQRADRSKRTCRCPTLKHAALSSNPAVTTFWQTCAPSRSSSSSSSASFSRSV